MLTTTPTTSLIASPDTHDTVLRRTTVALPSRLQGIAVSGVTASGKTSLVRALVAREPRLATPVTTTTRRARPGEQDGVHYHFVSRVAFEAARDAGAFLEYATVHGERYGLTRAAYLAVRERDLIPISILDVQGVMSVADALGMATVFLDAPIGDVLRRLAAERPSDEAEARADSLVREMAVREKYHFVVANKEGQFDQALAALTEIAEQVIAAAVDR
jgi:guanylate kinase